MVADDKAATAMLLLFSDLLLLKRRADSISKDRDLYSDN
jgi:hypothetical protein